MVEMDTSPSKVKRFYELDDLKKIQSALNRSNPTKIFACNHCSAWNRVNESDLFSNEDLVSRRKKEKKTVRIDLTPEFYVLFNQFKAHFGTYEAALIVLLDEFRKSNK